MNFTNNSTNQSHPLSGAVNNSLIHGRSLGPNAFGSVANDSEQDARRVGADPTSTACSNQVQTRSLGPNPFGVLGVTYQPRKPLKNVGHLDFRPNGLAPVELQTFHSRAGLGPNPFATDSSGEIWMPRVGAVHNNALETPPLSLVSLPDEILLLIADAFDLRNMFDLRSLKSLALVCRNISRVALDSLRVRMQIASCFKFEQKVLRYHYWDLLDDATMYNKYAWYCWKVVEFVSQAIRTPTFKKQAMILPLSGWENIFSVGLLLRARITGFGFDFPSKPHLWLACGIKVVEEQILEHPSSFTKVEKLALIYSCALFRIAFKSLHPDESIYHVWGDVRRSTQESISDVVLGSTFVMEGPLFLLRMYHGWRYDGLWLGCSNWLDTRAVYRMADDLTQGRLGMPCEVEPRKDAPIWLYNHVWANIKDLAASVTTEDLTPFTDIGLDKESAETLATCAKEWAAAPDQGFCPWYQRFRYS